MRKVLTVVLLAVILAFMTAVVVEMPPMGDPANVTNNEVPARYLAASMRETGVLNVVAGIITDYRALDTLGEATVLFVALAAALANLKAH
ncbi:MAG: hypothetical protein GX167_03690 [Firmicutes bacterium]|jgi:multisubunit Na+/H+ antiporter MnhB subunit|nr:hypothetical protein [Bacillota bacterium]